MLKPIFLILAVTIGFSLRAVDINPNNFKTEFNNAYAAYPDIPRGLLEAVAYAQTRINHRSGNLESCSGIPQGKGVMGLVEDGQGYFNNNLQFVAKLSGYSVNEIKQNPDDHIMAYAKAYQHLMELKSVSLTDFEGHDQLLKTLSEIPWEQNRASDYALSSFTYEVFSFLNNESYQEAFDLPAYNIDLESIYGKENLDVLQSEQILISTEAVESMEGRTFTKADRSAEYGPALWNAAPSCNYSSRSGTSISAVTVHTIQGSYAGAISWSQNCASNVSYHYVVRSSDGQVTQMVWEAYKAWHVGSENPYTIGIEHEGFVDDPAWYTEAMYTASASLVRDITESGYGINPLRTYKGPATVGTLTLGGCTKIKGHQHFPGASHTDPGVNWDWEHYYQLINNSLDITTLTATTGTFFDSGGAWSDYDDDERLLWLIQPPGATSIQLNTVSFNIESDWDYLYIYDGDDLDSPLIGVYTGTTIPDVITSSGGSLLIEFRSDCATTDPGWEFSWNSIIGAGVGDETPPVTEVETTGDWFSADFVASFTDEDEAYGSGVAQRYVQVIDYNGSEWRANKNNGFFSDNFDDAIHPDWTASTGSWTITDNVLKQSSEALSNTNIYATLNQNDHDAFLFHWGGKMSGSGTNKRAGLHFMCDNPALPNRGNSYFVWFREDHNKIQIYEVSGDVFSLTEEVEYDFAPNVWYDFKTTYDKTTGEINVWVNNVHSASWTDASPLTSGSAVSFRSGNTQYFVNNFKAYHSRESTYNVTVGVGGDARYQNPDPYTPAAKVKSIIIDEANNVSAIAEQLVNIDWTAPSAVSFVNDGLAEDVAATTSNTELKANWSNSIDENSGIAKYWYAIGSTAGEDDFVGWTNNWFADSVVHTGLELTVGTTYYFSVKVENGAGLFSETFTSNGQTVVVPTEIPTAAFSPDQTNICSADPVVMENSSEDALSYEWYIPGASPSYSTNTNPTVYFGFSGTYEVTLVANGPGGSDTLVQLLNIEVAEAPMANFSASADVVPVDDPLVVFSNTSTNADGFYWDFGDGTFATEASPSHLYDEINATYTITLVALNGDCPNDTLSKIINVDGFNGMNESEQTQIVVYPNPATDQFWVKNITSGNYFLTDMLGKQVIQGNVNELKNAPVAVGNLAAGTYLLTIINENERVVLEVQVSH